ncbi:P-loop containing nucleoside triphosphate hydrolase protein, partial [Eremomyces bilateralis CBS 781.70]
RLASVSVLEALQTESLATTPLSTQLRSLDIRLHDGKDPQYSSDVRSGGLPRRQIAELYGPPGSGKTEFCIQLAANAVCNGGNVLWIGARLYPNCSTKLFRPRFDQVLAAVNPKASTSFPGQMKERGAGLRHLATPSLAHLLSIIKRPPSQLGLEKKSLMILESLSTVVDLAYQRLTKEQEKEKKKDGAWRGSRKYAVLNDVASSLSKIAAIHNIAIVITNQTITRITGGGRALLCPSISGPEWENCISTKMVVFRDWGRKRATSQGNGEDEKVGGVHVIGLLKARGERLDQNGRFGAVIPFVIHEHGIEEVDLQPSAMPLAMPLSPTRPSTRVLADVIPDSEDELGSDGDFDWFEEADFAMVTDEPSEQEKDASQEDRGEGRKEQAGFAMLAGEPSGQEKDVGQGDNGEGMEEEAVT